MATRTAGAHGLTHMKTQRGSGLCAMPLPTSWILWVGGSVPCPHTGKPEPSVARSQLRLLTSAAIVYWRRPAKRRHSMGERMCASCWPAPQTLYARCNDDCTTTGMLRFVHRATGRPRRCLIWVTGFDATSEHAERHCIYRTEGRWMDGSRRGNGDPCRLLMAMLLPHKGRHDPSRREKALHVFSWRYWSLCMR